jgi:hypothetical protein
VTPVRIVRLVFLLAVAAACGGGGATPGDAGPDPGPDAFLPACTAEPCGSIRFFGQGGLRGDRVRMRLDDPATVEPGPPLDVGATDFTIELWLRGALADNPNTIDCGPGNNWVNSNIVVDRDRHSQFPAFGLGLQAGALVWAVDTDDGILSMCGAATVADGAWHHVAVDRRRGDGRMRIYVDGVLDTEADGPDGDAAYPDDGVPLDVCPDGVCDYSDPFLVVGAEKHGYGGISFAGWVDELRVSRRLRYDAGFPVPTAPFATDADTVGLYHFDDAEGTVARDSSGAQPSVDGELVLGGTPAGPAWSAESPFGQ